MSKSIKILKAMNDIDEKYLLGYSKIIESQNSHQNFIESVSKMKNIKLKYVLAPVMTFAIVLVCMIKINSINNKPKLEIARDNEIVKENDTKKDNIIFGTTNIRTLADIDGKPVKMDIISKFEFLKNLDIPKGYSLIDQWAIYERENINDTEYSKLWQYELSYRVINSKYEGNPENIGIIFTKEKQILQCMLPDKNTFPISTINGQKVYLFKSENNSGIQAFFEYNGYEFFVESSRVSESEFITLIKSIIK